MPSNRIVAHWRDGRLTQGSTSDFLPTRDVFHVAPVDSGPVVAVKVSELKGVFFVKDFAGDPGHRRRNAFEAGVPVVGRRIRVVFSDGEEIIGTTQAYQPGRVGFFVVPADVHSNTERCFVVSAATREVVLL